MNIRAALLMVAAVCNAVAEQLDEGHPRPVVVRSKRQPTRTIRSA